MEIIKIKINDLKPYEKNAKIHTREQIEQIKASINQFGMNDPIAVWGEENLIVEGHGRLEALKELGFKEVECIRLDHLTDEERKAYTLAHNKLTMNTDFDFDLLDVELEEITNIDMESFGFIQENFIEDLMQDSMYETRGNQTSGEFFEYSLSFPIEFKEKFETYCKTNNVDRRYFEEKIMEEVNNA